MTEGGANITDVQLISAIPVLPVSSVPDSLAFYRDRLGFTVDFEVPNLPYAGVRRGELMLHLDGGTHEFSSGPTDCRFHIRGVDGLFAELDPRGVVKPDERLSAMPYGHRQFSVLDLDGNRITFAEPIGCDRQRDSGGRQLINQTCGDAPRPRAPWPPWRP